MSENQEIIIPAEELARLQEKEHKRKSTIYTSIVVLLVLLLVWILGIVTPYPPPGEEGIMIDFGTTTTGSGNIDPESTNPTEAATPTASQASAQDQAEVATQSVEESADLNVSDQQNSEEVVNEQQTDATETTEVEEVEEDPTPEALYSGAQSNQNTESNEGLDELKSGDQGVLNGEDSPIHEGDRSYGKGTKGAKDNVKGWYMDKIPPINSKSQETGKVVIRVHVNRNGKVTSADFVSRGSSTTDSYLIQLAKKAALEAEFKTYMNTAVQKTGTITFHFTVE